MIDNVETALMSESDVCGIAWALNPMWSKCRGMVMVPATEKHVDEAIASAAIAAGKAITECNDRGVSAQAAVSSDIGQWAAAMWANKGEEFPPTLPAVVTPLSVVVDGRVTASFQIDLQQDFSRQAWWDVWLTLAETVDVTLTRWTRPLESRDGVRAGGMLTVADNSVEEVMLIADELIRSVSPEVRLRVRRMRGRQVIGRITSALIGIAPWAPQRKTLDCEL
ncbi:MAG: hypothetical protein SPK00_01660 [Corynebacterium glucuronolyticum]|nr:hypothetical protein [Mycobacteriaceae bacterium]MDY5833444.1 hypothetical protein [Corynebacterium glucuronolyticum]